MIESHTKYFRYDCHHYAVMNDFCLSDDSTLRDENHYGTYDAIYESCSNNHCILVILHLSIPKNRESVSKRLVVLYSLPNG